MGRLKYLFGAFLVIFFSFCVFLFLIKWIICVVFKSKNEQCTQHFNICNATSALYGLSEYSSVTISGLPTASNNTYPYQIVRTSNHIFSWKTFKMVNQTRGFLYFNVDVKLAKIKVAAIKRNAKPAEDKSAHELLMSQIRFK